jgi:hypothetical protein
VVVAPRLKLPPLVNWRAVEVAVPVVVAMVRKGMTWGVEETSVKERVPQGEEEPIPNL